MRKLLLSGFVIGVFGLYSLRLHSRSDEEASRIIVANTPTSTPTVEPISTPTAAGSTPPPTQAPTVPPQGKYKNGTYTGDVADAFYGNIQVQAVISGGKITDVIFLQYPNDRSTSIYINQQAMPLLRQEAIQAQSAQVDGVSGASASSQAFVESLQSALNKAI